MSDDSYAGLGREIASLRAELQALRAERDEAREQARLATVDQAITEAEANGYRAALEEIAKDADMGGAEGYYGNIALAALAGGKETG